MFAKLFRILAIVAIAHAALSNSAIAGAKSDLRIGEEASRWYGCSYDAVLINDSDRVIQAKVKPVDNYGGSYAIITVTVDPGDEALLGCTSSGGKRIYYRVISAVYVD
jgi:hypothetical protein